MTKYQIYCDGSYSPVLQKIGIGGSIYLKDLLLVEFSHSVIYNDHPQIHENYAINHALSLAKNMQLDEVTVFTDSQQIIQMVHKIKNGSKKKQNPLIKRTMRYLDNFQKIDFIKSDESNQNFKRVHDLSRHYLGKDKNSSFNGKIKNTPTFNGKPVTWSQLLCLYKK